MRLTGLTFTLGFSSPGDDRDPGGFRAGSAVNCEQLIPTARARQAISRTLACSEAFRPYYGSGDVGNQMMGQWQVGIAGPSSRDQSFPSKRFVASHSGLPLDYAACVTQADASVRSRRPTRLGEGQ